MNCVRESPKPNFVFFLVDDMGWRDAGFMGSTYYDTPNMDALANSGMVFTAAYANAPNCAPTRASLMTGLYTPRHGIYTVGTAERGKSVNRKLIPTKNTTVLDTTFVTLAEVLQQNGYATGHFGKWHLGRSPGNGPEQQGFDHNAGGNHSGHPKTYFSPYNNPELSDGADGEYLTDRLTDEALSFIETHQNEPFFLYFPHYAVHTPIQAKESVISQYANKPGSNGQDNPKYAAMITSTDESLGRVIDKLFELEIADNTIIIFFSDNGGHANFTSMQPLRGSKGMLYEGGIRVPMIVSWPGKIKAGSESDTPVIGIDFYPTILEIAGIDYSDLKLDGSSLLPTMLQTEELHRDAIFWHFPAYLEAYNKKQGIWRTTPAGAVRSGDWKLIEFFEDGRLELYNLYQDPGETIDLAQAHPEQTSKLHATIKTWRKQMNAPVPIERNSDFQKK